MRSVALGIFLAAAGCLHAEAPVIPVASVTPASLTPGAEADDESVAEFGKKKTEASGFSLNFGLSRWQVFNGAPLSYTLVEPGWAFGNGLRVQTGLDVFYYEGKQEDKDKKIQSYSYEMNCWRTSLLYRMPLHFWLRPVVGITAELTGGSRRLSPFIVGGHDANSATPKIDAWSYLGIGATAGLELLFSRDFSFQLLDRYTFVLGDLGAPQVIQGSFSVVF